MSCINFSTINLVDRGRGSYRRLVKPIFNRLSRHPHGTSFSKS